MYVASTAEVRSNHQIQAREGHAARRCIEQMPCPGPEEIKLDMRVDYVAFNKAWIAKLKEATREDPITGTVYQLTQQGWPHQ